MKHSNLISHQYNRPVSSRDLIQNGVDFAPSADEVARMAYLTYLNEGSPQGRDVRHWLDAEAHLQAERNETRLRI
jgi:hypothetical protein